MGTIRWRGFEVTFEEAERSDWPPPNWTDKESKEEEFSREIQSFTTENIEETRSVYDPRTETIRNEIKFGICSMCRESIFRNNLAVCFYGDQLCKECSIPYNGRSICRMHVESQIGGKDEAAVLIGITARLNKEDVKSLTSLSRKQIDSAKSRLVEKIYIKLGGAGLLPKEPKLTPIGIESMHTMIAAYGRDSDFMLYLKKIGWIKNVETRAGQQ